MQNCSISQEFSNQHIAEIIFSSKSIEEAFFMHFLAKKLMAIGYGTLLVTMSLSAAPMISVDSADFDIGIIREGEQKSIKHTFKIKNTGKDTLIIEKVKAG
ncbi:MAG: DUF1573 domain-containing protein [Chitinispirillaceae bacterium]|nr:DUF1573 domain-containing protein [Chitinispirillaceae bacterium]